MAETLGAVAGTGNENQVALKRRFSGTVVLSLLGVLLVAGALRFFNFPPRYELRDWDETPYLQGGLAMWEGITPGNREAPAASETWAVWLYAATRSALTTLHPPPQIAALPFTLRPYFAIDSVLFDIYQDMSGVHRFYLVVEFIFSLAGVYAAFQLGRHYAGIGGGILLGGAVALLPLYVEFAGQTRPYNDAWSFAFLALYSAAAVCGTRRWVQTGLFLGLAISSHLEMLAVIPLVLWLF